MERKDRLNALEIALENETKEREFYLANAERTANPLGKAMFESIAAEELDHYERLKKLHDAWQKDGSWPETVPLKVKETNIRKVLASVVDKTADIPPADDDDLAALQKAIEFEARGVEFYRHLSSRLSDPKEQKFFSLLAGIEEEHYRSLKETEEFLKDPAAWFRTTERGGLDGA